MIWQNVSPGICTAGYAGWHITRIEQYKDHYGTTRYEYIATKKNHTVKGASWEYIKTRVLATTQKTLF